MATRREATIPKLAPTPTTLLAHFHPIFRKAIANDAVFDIYKQFKIAYKFECEIIYMLWPIHYKKKIIKKKKIDNLFTVVSISVTSFHSIHGKINK
jgi:hypothetical protein